MNIKTLFFLISLTPTVTLAAAQSFYFSNSSKTWTPLAPKVKLTAGRYLTQNGQTVIEGQRISIKLLPFSRINIKKGSTSPVIDINVGGVQICLRKSRVQLQTAGSLQSRVKGYGCVHSFVFKKDLFIKPQKGVIKTSRRALDNGRIYRQSDRGWATTKKLAENISIRPSKADSRQILMEWMPTVDKYDVQLKSNNKVLLKARTQGNSVFTRVPSGPLHWALRAGSDLRVGKTNIDHPLLAGFNRNLVVMLLIFSFIVIASYFFLRKKMKSQKTDEDFLSDGQPNYPDEKILSIDGSLTERIHSKTGELAITEKQPRSGETVFQFCSDKIDLENESAVRFIERKIGQIEARGRTLIITELESQTTSRFHFVGFLNKQVSLSQILVQDFAPNTDWIANMGIHHPLQTGITNLKGAGLSKYGKIVFLDIFDKEHLWTPILQSLDLCKKSDIRPNIEQRPATLL